MKSVSRDASANNELADMMAKYYADPLGYVMFMFPWDTLEDIQIIDWTSKAVNPFTDERLCDTMGVYADRFNSQFGPDLWACQFLDELGKDIIATNFDGRTPVEPIQYATASGHGIGKSTLVAWLIKFIMDTRPGSKGTVTANTAEQLKTKTWAELGKWHRISLTEHWFNYNSGRGAMNLVHKTEQVRWRCDAQTCREENSEAFAGQHSASASSFYIFDEASAVPDSIFIVREGGTTDGQPMVFDFGNPTRNSGRFYEHCMGRFRHRYKVRCIDSRTVWLPNKTRITAWLEDYGEDSDFFKVRVRGMFPSAGSTQFISSGSVDEAQAREVVQDKKQAQLLIGVDVARFGENESVIYPRVGFDARSWPAHRYQGLDTVQLTGKVIECVRDFKNMGITCAGLFVDGGGVGGGVVDQLRALRYNPIEIQFGEKAINFKTYRYRSDEMWGNMRDAMSKLCLPANNQLNGVDLRADLTQREFGYTLMGNKIHLETKKDMMKRGITSPDLGDGLALTFAQEVAPANTMVGMENQVMMDFDYDPMETNW